MTAKTKCMVDSPWFVEMQAITVVFLVERNFPGVKYTRRRVGWDSCSDGDALGRLASGIEA